MSFLLILIVAGVIFLAMLGKHGWNPFMRVLLVLAVVPIALLFVARISHQEHWSPVPTATVDMAQISRDGRVLVEQTGEVELAGLDGQFTTVPIHSQMLVPDPARGIFNLQAQVRPPFVRGSPIAFLLFVVGLVGGVLIYQVRRGSWTWPVVMKVGAIAVGVCLVIMIGMSLVSHEQSRSRAQRFARIAATEMERVRREEQRGQPRPVPVISPGSELGRFGDVEVWRRESVLDWVPVSLRRTPSWCREGLETGPEIVQVQDTRFVSHLPEGRTWVVGYSSQDPQISAAREEAIAAAQRKLGIAALVHVKKAVPELDVRPLEEVTEWLAMRAEHFPDSIYTERATLGRDRKPYGTVFRAAARIRADPSTIDDLARRICKHVDRFGASPQPDLQVAFFSGMILVVLAFSAFLVYVFIRAGAAGRWVHPLRLVSGGMLVALVVAVIYVSRNLGAS